MNNKLPHLPGKESVLLEMKRVCQCVFWALLPPAFGPRSLEKRLCLPVMDRRVLRGTDDALCRNFSEKFNFRSLSLQHADLVQQSSSLLHQALLESAKFKK